MRNCDCAELLVFLPPFLRIVSLVLLKRFPLQVRKVVTLITGEFRVSINQLESELTNSRKELEKKFHKLKIDFQKIQKYIVEKNQLIADLKEQRKDLLSLLDQTFAIIDDPSQIKLIDDLRDIEAEVATLMGIAKSNEQTAADSGSGDGSAPRTATKNEGSKAEPGEQIKEWAKDVLKGIGEAPRAAATSSSKA